MSKESTKWKRTQLVGCPETESGAHCWHFSNKKNPKHEHSFDRCCFCKKSGVEIFGPGYAEKKKEEETINKSGR